MPRVRALLPLPTTVRASRWTYGPVVQLVRTPACHAGGRGFEPHPSRQLIKNSADLAHLVERDLAKVEVAGSSPVIRSTDGHEKIVPVIS